MRMVSFVSAAQIFERGDGAKLHGLHVVARRRDGIRCATGASIASKVTRF
jgi:hypothetical protein